MGNFILLLVGIFLCTITVSFADEGTATYYTAPYVREYYLILFTIY